MRRPLILLVMALMGATVVLVSGVAYALTVHCDAPGDQDPDPGECRGTRHSDVINGSSGSDEIRALAGNDRINPHQGNDTVFGGMGKDSVDAHQGNDTVYGGLDGDGGRVGLRFSKFGGTVNLEGAEDSDTVYGKEGSDNIDAAATDTTGSFDRSLGGRGNDRIYSVDDNEDIVNCGVGTGDVALIDQGIDTPVNCERVRRV